MTGLVEYQQTVKEKNKLVYLANVHINNFNRRR